MQVSQSTVKLALEAPPRLHGVAVAGAGQPDRPRKTLQILTITTSVTLFHLEPSAGMCAELT